MESHKLRNPIPKPASLSNSEKKAKEKEDLTGSEKLVANVIFSWTGHIVFIIAGFILPRMIDQRLGQDVLGIWDFAWSLVNYFGLVGAGITSSVNRYVAKYRISGDIPALNGMVSSAAFIMNISGLLVLGLSIIVSLLMPLLFGNRLGENINEAQWVVFFLGAGIGVEIAFGAFNGVLTGCHRWGLQNIINSSWHAITIIGMIVALLLNSGLRILALIYLIGIVMTCITRMISAYLVCEHLRVHPSFIKWKTIKKAFTFGVKTLIPSISKLLFNQTTSVLIVLYLGTPMLALYTRPRSLLLHANTLVKKMGLVLIPTASSLQSEGNMEKIRTLLIKSVRYSFYMVLPIVLTLIVFGGTIMRFWMGPDYDDSLVPGILAAGFLMIMAQTPIWVILVGLNAHGRAGIAELIASLISAGLIFFGLKFLKLELPWIAIAVTAPLTIMNLTYLPLLICRRIGLDVKRYFLSVTIGPVIHVLPFALSLIIARLIFKTQPFVGLLWGGTLGTAALAVLYYRYVLPDRIKMRLLRYWRIKGSII
ncbi:MAG: oligosaccharide flippase family protein [Candidatus Hodarchaeota archaeon]